MKTCDHVSKYAELNRLAALSCFTQQHDIFSIQVRLREMQDLVANEGAARVRAFKQAGLKAPVVLNQTFAFCSNDAKREADVSKLAWNSFPEAYSACPPSSAQN